MTDTERAEFDRQLKGVQSLARHFKTTVTGLSWRDGHLTGLFAGDPATSLPEPEEKAAKVSKRGLQGTLL